MFVGFLNFGSFPFSNQATDLVMLNMAANSTGIFNESAANMAQNKPDYTVVPPCSIPQNKNLMLSLWDMALDENKSKNLQGIANVKK